jgi:hypothetical protein
MADLAPTLLAMASGPAAAAGAAGAAAEVYPRDGISFLPHLLKTQASTTGNGTLADADTDAAAAPRAAWARDAVLIEYQSLQGGPNRMQCGGRDWRDAYGFQEREEREGLPDGLPFRTTPMDAGCSTDAAAPHAFDSPNNTFAALRVFGKGGGDGGDSGILHAHEQLYEFEHGLLYAEFADVSNPKAWDFAPNQLNFHELYNMSADPFMLTNIYGTADKGLLARLHARLQGAIACKGADACTASLGPQP